MKPNLSDQEFFNLHVKDNNWHPLQNHGLIDKEIKLKKEDLDFPNQITAYLNLFKNIEIDNKFVLDIGCGWGRGTYVIKKYFKKCSITGVDINYSFINHAKSNYKECNYVQDNLYKTKLKNSSFDLIILNCSMHFFYDQDVVLQNIKKILKHKGKILITDLWTKESFIIFLQKCKENKLKILSIEDQTNNTIESMKKDISKTFLKFKDKVDKESILAFINIQKERLSLFENNVNRHYKFVIQ
tara:strand:- start:2996 stop:3721 length:726 start_codon:yes stop_codon:yes gene_type:complete